MEDSEEKDIVTIAKFKFPFQADILASRLESEGIVVFIHNQTNFTVQPITSVSEGTVLLMVNRLQEKQALEIIAELESKVAPDVELHEALEVDGLIYDLVRGICPRCEKSAVYMRRSSSSGTSGTIAVVEFFVAMNNRKYFCYNCEHEWQ